MKSLFIGLALLMLPLLGISQVCSVDKCVNQSAAAQVSSPQPGYTYNWTISPALVFVGQGASAINIPSVGNLLQAYTVSCLVTAPNGCDTTIVCTINVNTSTAQLNLPSICRDNGLVDLTQYATPPGGAFSGNGVVGNSFNPAVGSSNITYSVVATNGCSASTVGVITVLPTPQPGVIQIN
jgi:hypothetical protein